MPFIRYKTDSTGHREIQLTKQDWKTHIRRFLEMHHKKWPPDIEVYFYRSTTGIEIFIEKDKHSADHIKKSLILKKDGCKNSAAAKIFLLRKKMKLSQKSLAKLCGMSRSQLARIEIKKRSLSLKHAQALAAVFNLPVSELL